MKKKYKIPVVVSALAKVISDSFRGVEKKEQKKGAVNSKGKYLSAKKIERNRLRKKRRARERDMEYSLHRGYEFIGEASFLFIGFIGFMAAYILIEGNVSNSFFVATLVIASIPAIVVMFSLSVSIFVSICEIVDYIFDKE